MPSTHVISSIELYTPFDRVPDREKANLGIILDQRGEHDGKLVRAMWVKEYRTPKQGEWYLSGAIINAYRAINDMSSPYHIAKLVVIDDELF